MPGESTVPATRSTAGRNTVVADAETRAELERLDALARTLDARIRIPLTDFRIGLDGLIGLVPAIGDTLALLPSGYLLVRGWQLGARKRTLARMAGNSGIDYVVGLVPLVGDLFDIGYKSNLRNVALLKAEIAPRPPRPHGCR